MTDTYCEYCGKPLEESRATYLELSATDGRYWLQLPSGHESQGGFPFGKDCASKIAADGPI